MCEYPWTFEKDCGTAWCPLNCSSSACNMQLHLSFTILIVLIMTADSIDGKRDPYNPEYNRPNSAARVTMLEANITGKTFLVIQFGGMCEGDSKWFNTLSVVGVCDHAIGECVCISPFYGLNCSVARCPNDCNGADHGTCDITTGKS